MADILYQDFLLNEKKYDEAVQLWEEFFDEILEAYGHTRQAYLNNVTANGAILRDGNPIFHAYIPEIDRAVRIIQEEPEEPADFGSWINVTEWPDGTSFRELVISLVLTEDTKAEAQQAIRQWIETGQKRENQETSSKGDSG